MQVQHEPSHHVDDMRTPTAAQFDSSISQQQSSEPASLISSSANPTPTRNSLSEKRPLSPQEPSASATSLAPPSTEGDLSRQESLQSLKSNDTHGSGNTGNAGEEAIEGSDRENDDGSSRPQKKKRSQRFFCTEYPPCNLSFTRSEHLARHIRKHTGERPFQCHCLRRFSRLDNLRQHAQTVHVNEEIPIDSLAATGTRFQRQIRTEKMPAPRHRQRASTLSSGSHSRGHSRNVSGSSIGSVSEFGAAEDARRRPQPLAMAQPNTPRPGLSVDTYNTNMAGAYYNYSPSGYSTPMSAYSAEATSPRTASTLGSPIAMMPRTTIGWGGQNHSRRLSVPSSVHPFSGQQHFMTPQAPFMSPMMHSPSPYYANISSTQISPPRDSGMHARHQSLDAMDAEWRRRTWHPTTRQSFESRPATSGLSYHQKPDDPEAVPTTQPAAAQQSVRLPGIDSFDRSSMQTTGSGRRNAEGMDIDPSTAGADTEASSKRNSWNSMNQNMHQLDIMQGTPPNDNGMWRYSSSNVQPVLGRPMTAPQATMIPPSLPSEQMVPGSGDQTIDPTLQQPLTPRISNRLDVNDMPTSPPVGEPGPTIRTSPDGSANSEEVHTPSAAADYRPAIMHPDGSIEREHMAHMHQPQKEPAGPSQVSESGLAPRGHDTQRLDALVAVATSEDQAIAQH